MIIILPSWKKPNDSGRNETSVNSTFRIPAYSDELKLRMEQRAIITALVLQDDVIRRLFVTAVKNKVEADNQNDEAITFDEIESPQVQYIMDFANAFKPAYKNILESENYFRSEKFVSLSHGEPSGRLISYEFDPVFYYNDGAQIYFPYSEDLNDIAAGKTSVYVTYHPLEEVEQNEAFLGNSIEDKTNATTMIVDENYAMNNPVFVVNFNEAEAKQQQVQDPPPPTYLCNFLTYNTFADVLDDRYVISVTMPKIKLLDNFRSWIGGTNRLTIYQCFAKPGNLNINPSPALDPITPDKRAVFTDFQIKRKNKGKWIDFGQIYNDDWRLIQYDNPFVAYYKAGWFSSPTGSTDVNVSGGVKLDTIHIDKVPPYEADSIRYQWIKSFNAGATANLHISMGNQYNFIGTDYVSRRGLFANCVGDNFGNGTATQAGETTPWAVRKMSDKFLFYFKVRECHQ